MVNNDTIRAWLRDYADLKHREAASIEKEHGPGWISDAKYATAKEVNDWLSKEKVDKPVKISYHGVGQSDNVNLPYTEEVYEDGTIRRVITILPEHQL